MTDTPESSTGQAQDQGQAAAEAEAPQTHEAPSWVSEYGVASHWNAETGEFASETLAKRFSDANRALSKRVSEMSPEDRQLVLDGHRDTFMEEVRAEYAKSIEDGNNEQFSEFLKSRTPEEYDFGVEDTLRSLGYSDEHFDSVTDREMLDEMAGVLKEHHIPNEAAQAIYRKFMGLETERAQKTAADHEEKLKQAAKEIPNFKEREFAVREELKNYGELGEHIRSGVLSNEALSGVEKMLFGRPSDPAKVNDVRKVVPMKSVEELKSALGKFRPGDRSQERENLRNQLAQALAARKR